MAATKKPRRTKGVRGAGLLLVLLRWARGWWDQGTLAVRGGFHSSQVSMWERDIRDVPAGALETAADVTEFPRYLLDSVLRALRSFRQAARGKSRPSRRLSEIFVIELFPLIASVLDLVLEPRAAEEGRRETVSSPSAADRDLAGPLLHRLLRRNERQRRLLVDDVAEFRQWALAERLTWESLAAAPNQPKEALALAELAVRIAGLVPGAKEWCWRVEGFALAALTNAQRVCNDKPAARKSGAIARRLWEDGAPGDPGLLLNPAVLPWVEAVLHWVDSELPQALQRIDEALALDDGKLRGKILLSKANIHDAKAEPEASTQAVLEALPFVDFEREPRIAWMVHHMLVRDLVFLDRAGEATEKLPEVRRLAERLGGEIDLHRAVCLEGMVAAGLGDLAKARTLFEQARTAFQKPELSHLHALASLELSVVLLKQGETARVRTIALEMAVLFKSQQLPKETLAALRIFCEAAKRETATVELARKVARFLHRSQDDPEIKFDDKAGAS